MSQKNEEAKAIKAYLITYCRQYAKDKALEKVQELLEKIAVKLGVYTFNNLVANNFPGGKLASFLSFGLKMIFFEGSYIAKFEQVGAVGLNPFDPIENSDAYVDYLLFSWAKGKVGYVYDNVKDYGPLNRHPTP